MGELLHGVLDVTIVYPQGRPSVVDLLTGRIQTIRVDLRVLAIPAALVDGDDEHARVALRNWLNAIWADKDQLIEQRLVRSEEHTSELQSLMRISSAVFCLKKKTNTTMD